MLAGIIGDVVGSVYEAHQWQNRNMDLFQPLPIQGNLQIKSLVKDLKWVRKDFSWTDDTLCTLALYAAYIEKKSPKEALLYFCKKYANQTIGFGGAFTKWLENPVPYESYGNGCLMRIGFIPFLNISLEEKLKLAESYTGISHNHRESFQSVHDFITLMNSLGNQVKSSYKDKSTLTKYLLKNNYEKTIDSLHNEAKFEMNAKQTLLQAVLIVLESESIEEVLKNSFYVGGDCDTLACIASNLASALYPIPQELLNFSLNTLVKFEELDYLVKHFRNQFW